MVAAECAGRGAAEGDDDFLVWTDGESGGERMLTLSTDFDAATERRNSSVSNFLKAFASGPSGPCSSTYTVNWPDHLPLPSEVSCWKVFFSSRICAPTLC